MSKLTPNQQRKHDSYWRYCLEWGNFKSDKYKRKAWLRGEIRDILIFGSFTKKDLISIKNHIKEVGFKEI